MEKYIEGNKAAWEEAFENRDASWGDDITERIRTEEYPFFNEETKSVLKKLHTEGAVIGQFCCNNGRELLSLVKSGRAKQGVGFDIAENQVAFANEKAKALGLPCAFEAVNIYDIDDRYREQLDVALITIGALCWFDDLDRFFAVVRPLYHGAAAAVTDAFHAGRQAVHVVARAADGAEFRAVLELGAALYAEGHGHFSFRSELASFPLIDRYYHVYVGYATKKHPPQSIAADIFWIQNEKITPTRAEPRMKKIGCSFFVALTARVSTSSTAVRISALTLNRSEISPLRA